MPWSLSERSCHLGWTSLNSKTDFQNHGFCLLATKNPSLNRFPLVGSVPVRRRYCPCTYHSTSAGVSTHTVLKPRSPEQSTSCTRRTLYFQMTEILKNTCIIVTLSSFTPSAHHMHGGTIFLFNPLHSFPQKSCTRASPQGRSAPEMNQLLPVITASALQEVEATV